MPGRLFAMVLALGALILGGEARAQQWITSAWSNESVYEVDLSSVSRSGDVAQTWVRETLKRTAKDPTTGKPYSALLAERYDDCANRKYALGRVVRSNARGQIVSSAPSASGWDAIAPGTVAESVWRVACAVTSKPAGAPFLDDLSQSRWTSLGASADGKYHLYAAIDRVIKVSDTHALVLSRSDYIKPEFISGLPIKHIVSAQVVDCKSRKMGGFGADFYMTPALRVASTRVDQKDVQLQNFAPGSFGFNNLATICAAAVKVDRPERAAEEPKIVTGTAWAVTKGYLVTSAHVVEGAEAIAVYNNGERMGEARIVTADATNDLAILKVEKWTGPSLTALPLAVRAAALGKSVFILGYPAPGVLGQRIKMTAGEISSTAGIQDDARILQISVPIQGGNSGGPVMGWDGAVVGVVESSLERFGDDEDKASSTPQMINYAVKAAYLRPLLDDLPDLGNHKPLKSQLSSEALIEEARKSVFMLVVAR